MSALTAIKNYFVGSFEEMKKVNWPSKQQTINYSVLVFGLCIGLAVFFAILDYIFNLGITKILTR